METKHYVALVVLVALSCGSVLLTLFSHRLRDVAFLVMVASAVIAERFDVNFLGEYWYRGTSRGIGVTLIDVLALSVLVSALAAPRYFRRPWFVPAGFVVYAVYFVYCAFSVAHAWDPHYGVWELANLPRAMLITLATAAFVRTRRELALLVLGLACAACIEGVYAFKQRFISGMFRPAGTLDHANSLSMYLCLITPVLLAAALSDWNKYLRGFALFAAAVASVCVLMTLSRMGLPTYALVMGGTLAMCVTWRVTRRKVLTALVVGVAATVMLVKSWDMLVVRFGSATFKEEFVEIEGENRGIYWRWARMMVDDDPFGVGLNNWSYAVSKHYGTRVGFFYEDYDDIKNAPEKADLPSIRYAPPAHALAAITLGEVGIPGLILFLLVWLRWFHVGIGFLWRRLNSDPMHRVAIGVLFGTVGIFLQSLTEWTYRQPALFLTFHMMMGALASLHYARRHAKSPAEQAAAEELEVVARPVAVPAMVAER